MQNCNAQFSQRAGGQGYFKVVLTIRSGVFKESQGLCELAKHVSIRCATQKAFQYAFCHAICARFQVGGDICERLRRISNVKEMKDSLCVRKFT